MALALGSTLNPINSTMIAPALVPITRDLHATGAETSILVAATYVSSAVALPLMGRLADRFGPRRVYLISLIIVALSGVLGAIVTSLWGLICVRAFLGIGTSGAYPSVMRLFRTRAGSSAPPRNAMAMLAFAASSSAAIGPVLGGALTSVLGWRAIFTVNAPLALVALALSLLWVPRDSRIHERMNKGAQGMPKIIGSIARNGPLMRTYLRAATMSTIVYSMGYGYAQWLEGAGKYSAAQAGLMTIPMALVAGISSFAGARTRQIRTGFSISIVSALIGAIILTIDSQSSPILLIAVGIAFFGTPQGMFNTASQTVVYLQAPENDVGVAAGLQRTAQYIGAIGASVLLAATLGIHESDRMFHALTGMVSVACIVLYIGTAVDGTIPGETAIASSRN